MKVKHANCSDAETLPWQQNQGNIGWVGCSWLGSGWRPEDCDIRVGAFKLRLCPV